MRRADEAEQKQRKQRKDSQDAIFARFAHFHFLDCLPPFGFSFRDSLSFSLYLTHHSLGYCICLCWAGFELCTFHARRPSSFAYIRAGTHFASRAPSFPLSLRRPLDSLLFRRVARALIRGGAWAVGVSAERWWPMGSPGPTSPWPEPSPAALSPLLSPRSALFLWILPKSGFSFKRKLLLVTPWPCPSIGACLARLPPSQGKKV